MLQKGEKIKAVIRHYLPLSMTIFPSRKTYRRCRINQENQDKIKQGLTCIRTDV